MTLQKRATIVASITAFCLIILKLVVGIATGMVVIIASAIDSLLDFAVSLFNFWAVKTSERPSDEQFNYGRGKIEAIASVVEGGVVTLSGFLIIYAAIEKIQNDAPVCHLDWALGVMVVSTIVTFFLVTYLNRVAKKTGSMVLKADALHYKTDLYTNAGIIVSLIAVALTGYGLIDPFVGIVIAVYIIASAFGIIKEGLLTLMDRAIDENFVVEICKLIPQASSKVRSFHHLRTRHSGSMMFVDVHVVFDDKILLAEAHKIGDEIEDAIKNLDVNAKWVINIHLDPRDDSQKDII